MCEAEPRKVALIKIAHPNVGWRLLKLGENNLLDARLDVRQDFARRNRLPSQALRFLRPHLLQSPTPTAHVLRAPVLVRHRLILGLLRTIRPPRTNRVPATGGEFGQVTNATRTAHEIWLTIA